MKIDAVVLAGAPAGDFEDDVPLSSRAMVTMNGRTMLDHVLEPVYKNENISRTCAVGSVVSDFADVILEPEDTLIDNIKKALAEFVTADYVLLCTSDIPLIDTDCITDFLDQALDEQADAVYPVCRKEVCEELYPDLQRTYVRIAEGEFTGGNVMLIRTEYFSRLIPVIDKLYRYRKQPVKLARIMGLEIILRLILSRLHAGFLDLRTIEKKASELLGGGVIKAVITPRPEICEDLDKKEELPLFEAALKERSENL
ncbi:MAG: nucleotidyltransferase family protein [Abditibacteriota bacterium]|nr:nucleotidyltransferase family protein [Abditibacteriota bacterium]